MGGFIMYKVCIYNNNVETVIHYPTPDQSAPHLFKADLTEKDNDIDTFSFSLYSNNPGYNLLMEFKTKIKIIDTRDNSVRFTGRILKPVEDMDNTGFYKEVDCENAFAYLLDSNVRDLSILSSTLTNALTTLLNRHNASVDADKQIWLGNVDELNSLVLNCNYETTQAALLNLIKDIDRHYQVRETNGILYLDCLQTLNNTVVDVRLGVNMRKLIKTYDPSNLATRIIPLGANNLTIASINSGIDYIEDVTAKGVYGIVEKPVSYSDITDATTLKSTAQADLSNYTQPLIS
jgi:phage minor structural protein